MPEHKQSQALIDTILNLGFVEDLGGLTSQQKSALKETLLTDVKGGQALDITTLATIEEGQIVEAELVLKEPSVIACLDVFALVLHTLDEKSVVTNLVEEGIYIDETKIPLPVARIRGQARALLMGERLALNLVQRLFGIATMTRKYTSLTKGTNIAILDTRKTTPGLRVLEKRAVVAGGGTNHRMGLFDAVLIKDNHIKASGSVTAAVTRVRTYLDAHPQIKNEMHKPIEVEVASLEQLDEALSLGVEAVLLDNMKPAQVKEAIERIQKLSRSEKKCFVEVSGGVNLTNLKGYLIEGVDAISIGALTHSATNVDLSLEF